MTYDFTRTYWNREDAEQAKYDEMEAAGFVYTKTTDNVFHRYYRFFNDGDCPASMRWVMRQPYSIRERNPEYIAYCQNLEEKVTERILAEYRRFKAAQKKG